MGCFAAAALTLSRQAAWLLLHCHPLFFLASPIPYPSAPVGVHWSAALLPTGSLSCLHPSMCFLFFSLFCFILFFLTFSSFDRFHILSFQTFFGDFCLFGLCAYIVVIRWPSHLSLLRRCVDWLVSASSSSSCTASAPAPHTSHSFSTSPGHILSDPLLP